jgi:hypothetical protein
MNQLISDLRALPPKRPLTYGESLYILGAQAARVRAWAAAWANREEPALNLIWLLRQRAVPAHLVPSYRLGEQSGLTTDRISGRLEMYVNQSEPRVRQRFSLLHEFKHVLDFTDADVLHAKLGQGNPQRQGRQIELLCNEFAAQVLMPALLVKRAWYQLHDLETVAVHFNVSVEALGTRLEKLNLIGDPRPAPRTYFRRAGSLPELGSSHLPAAA